MHLLPALALLAPSLAAQAGDWPQFRGPGGLAVADDAPIPTDFGPDAKVLWRTQVPAGHSSPCIVGARIYLTGFEEGADVVLALDRQDGKVLWTKRFQGTPTPRYEHPDAAPAQPTPVSDGERVVAYFGNYGLVALDPAGELLWEKRLAQPRAVFGVGTSPILVDGLLVLSRDGTGEGGVVVYDVTDGSELTRIRRLEIGESHGTPFLWRNADRDELVVSGSGRLSSYDPGTGEELWRLDGLTSYPCTTPTADRDTLYFAAWSTPNANPQTFWEVAFERSLELTEAELADPAVLFRRLDRDGDGKIVRDELPECRAKDAFGVLDRDRSGAWEPAEVVAAGETTPGPGENVMVAVARGAAGDAGKEHVRWRWKRGLPYVSSPLLYRGRIWLFAAGGLATVLDAKTGAVIVDRERLSDRAEYYLSPVGAAGHVLAGSAEGTLYLLAADAPELTVEHTVTFDEGLFATPAVLGGIVYLRTATSLYAFGER
ncbi:MAG TPA: PQQ-binding-like beta-propeller repeat protein [Planctomycetota bacterium]